MIAGIAVTISARSRICDLIRLWSLINGLPCLQALLNIKSSWGQQLLRSSCCTVGQHKKHVTSFTVLAGRGPSLTGAIMLSLSAHRYFEDHVAWLSSHRQDARPYAVEGKVGARPTERFCDIFISLPQLNGPLGL